MKKLIEQVEQNARVLSEGAATFMTRSRGSSADEAFARAVKLYQDEEGRNGYTGTIAEKRSFVLIRLPKDKDPMVYARELIDQSDARIDDKWGPAGAFDLGGNNYLFFGWASE